MIDVHSFFDRSVKSDMRTYENIRTVTTGQGNDCTNGCLLHYSYFQGNYKLFAIDLSKQQTLDADPKPIQQIKCAGNLE